MRVYYLVGYVLYSDKSSLVIDFTHLHSSACSRGGAVSWTAAGLRFLYVTPGIHLHSLPLLRSDLHLWLRERLRQIQPAEPSISHTVWWQNTNLPQLCQCIMQISWLLLSSQIAFYSVLFPVIGENLYIINYLLEKTAIAMHNRLCLYALLLHW